MSDGQISPGLITDILDVLDRHAYARADNEQTSLAILFIGDLACTYQAS